MYQLIRPILFSLDPETAHNFTLRSLHTLSKWNFAKWGLKRIFGANSPSHKVEVAGLQFKNRVGLAAGLDKNAEAVEALACFGFGFIEIGTVTPLPQPGNDKPRMFRLPKDQGLINRMGFNNLGVDVVAQRLKNIEKGDLVIGGNIGKNKVTPNENAVNDYCICFDKLFDVVDYFVVNVSSPNTPNLRALQEKEPLMHILQTLQDKNVATGKAKPIFLKIAPDLNESQLDDIIDIVSSTKIAGIIATNTTLDRNNLITEGKITNETGGLSGKPLLNKSTEVVRYLAQKSNQAFPIIAAGGIFDENDAVEKLDAGASLVQIYSGFIYQGPSLINRINKKILSINR